MDFIFEVDEMAGWLKGFGIWAVLISLLINIFISIIGVIPSVFLSGANAVVFGLVPGFWISLSGEVLGAAVSYWLYKWGFGKIKIGQRNWSWLQKLKGTTRKRQIAILLVARITPFVPSAVITFIAAIANMRFIDFIIVTFIGKAPSIGLETLVGHDLITINDNYTRLSITLILLVIIYVLFRQGNKKKR